MITSKELENNVAKINEACKSILDSLTYRSFRCAKDLKNLKDELERKLTYYVAKYNNEKNIDFSRGRLVGIAQCLDIIIEFSENKYTAAQDIDDAFAQIKTVSHGGEILKLLSLKRGVQHKDLCESLKITAGTLTGIIDKLCEMDLIYFTKIGKFKFYYLTDFGYKFKEEKYSQTVSSLSKLESELLIEKEKNKQLQKLLRKIYYFPTRGNTYLYFENYSNPKDINKYEVQTTHILKRKTVGNNKDANINQYLQINSLRSFQDLKV